MYESEKKYLIYAGKELLRYNLVSLSGGNVSARIGEHVIVTPSGMDYESLNPSDIVVVDMAGNVVEGDRRPSVDIGALLYIYNGRSDVHALIHTHQVYATSVGLVADELPPVVTTLINATRGAVKVAPYSSAASVEMGVKTVENLGDTRAVILKNHGVVTAGTTIKEALYAAVYLEDAAKSYLLARSVGQPAELDQAQVAEAVAVFENYGQSSSSK